MTLEDIKKAFFQSDCGKYIREGTQTSEPIPSLENGKLIDVFFIYKVNREKGICTKPIAKFGIIAETKEMVFAEPLFDSLSSDAQEDMICDSMDRKEVEQHYQDYEQAYNNARSLFYHDCTDTEKEKVRDYWRTFEQYVEPNMVKYYMETVPKFYSWVQSQIL